MVIKITVWLQIRCTDEGFSLASVRKFRGKWQATIRRKGHKSISRTFSTKGAACTFARRVEFEMDVAQNPDDVSALSQITLAELITRYRDTVTPTKKGIQQETTRMNYCSHDLT